LMSNHFHLLLKPAPGQSISRILQSLTVAHTWRHHRRQGTRAATSGRAASDPRSSRTATTCSSF
jgi:REP element-mobilizing transposase RayT